MHYITVALLLLTALVPLSARAQGDMEEVEMMTKRYTDSGILLEFTLRERQDGTFGVEDVGCVPIYCWKQENNIQAISSLKYLSEPPEGMSSGTWQRMKDSYWELRNLIDESIPMLAE